MLLNDLMKKLDSIKNGAFTRIAYESEVPVKAEFKKQGMVIRKVTEKTCRLGIRYGNLSVVKNAEPKPDKKPRKNNYEYVVKNKITHNSSTNKDYLDVYSCKNDNKRIHYVVSYKGKVVNVEHLPKGFVIDSYCKKSDDSVLKRVNVENIIKVG